MHYMLHVRSVGAYHRSASADRSRGGDAARHRGPGLNELPRPLGRVRAHGVERDLRAEKVGQWVSGSV